MPFELPMLRQDVAGYLGLTSRPVAHRNAIGLRALLANRSTSPRQWMMPTATANPRWTSAASAPVASAPA